MSASAVIALRKAALAALTADAVLADRLGDPRIYDEAPRATRTPYLTLGDASARDWSTSSDRATEQFLVIHVWSEHRGLREALDLAADAQRILDDANLALESHRLVSLRFISLETRRDNNGRFARASLRFRALTEPN